MIPNTFEYHKASSVDDAIQALSSGEAKILAGGHSLIPAMKLRLNSPGKIVDISKLSDLKYIREAGNQIAIGAGTTHAMIAASDVIQAKLSMMSQAAGVIGDPQVRNAGTIGGSIAHADPSADWPASLLAAGFEVAVKGPGGSRVIAGEDFFQGFYTTALGENEIITEIRVNTPSSGSSSAYAKFMQPASRFAIVGCAALITVSGGVCSDVRIGFTGVSDVAFRDSGVENALKGKAPTADNIAEAASRAAEGIDIMSDHFASETYRKHLAKVYAKRALVAAAG